MADFEKKKKKKKNGRVLLSLILLLIAAGTAFYFGWVQAELPENTYGVLFSKTSGYSKKILNPGEFNWKWEKILPTNSKLIKIKTEIRNTKMEYSGLLPSGDLYSSILQDKPDFSFKIQYTFSYILDHKLLPSLVENKIIDTDNMEEWYKTVESQINNEVKKISFNYFSENKSDFSSGYLNLENRIAVELEENYNYLIIKSFTMNYINFPDLQLYQKSKEIYFQILEKRKDSEIILEKRAVESKINLESKLELLSRYGDLLTKFPILLEYFALKPESQILDINMLNNIEKKLENQD